MEEDHGGRMGGLARRLARSRLMAVGTSGAIHGKGTGETKVEDKHSYMLVDDGMRMQRSRCIS